MRVSPLSKSPPGDTRHLLSHLVLPSVSGSASLGVCCHHEPRRRLAPTFVAAFPGHSPAAFLAVMHSELARSIRILMRFLFSSSASPVRDQIVIAMS